MKAVLVAGLAVIGCGSVKNNPSDGGPADVAIDADPSPHLVFVTSEVVGGAMGGLAGADALCQRLADASGLDGTFMAWLANATQAPADRMTQHIGPYQLVTGAVVAQGWADLTDGNLAARIDRTETGLQLNGVGCDANQPTCHFVCEGGEVWSNVDGAGRRRNTVDCGGWIDANATGTAGNVGKTDVNWTAGACSAIGCGSTLPIFCVEQ